jgi:hypothetical protein
LLRRFHSAIRALTMIDEGSRASAFLNVSVPSYPKCWLASPKNPLTFSIIGAGNGGNLKRTLCQIRVTQAALGLAPPNLAVSLVGSRIAVWIELRSI